MHFKPFVRPAAPFALMLALGACASSGPKKPFNWCDQVQTVNDPFEGKSQRVELNLALDRSVRMAIVKKPSGAVVEILARLPAHTVTVTPAGAPAEFILGDQIVTVNLKSDAQPERNTEGTEWHLEYDLSPDFLALMMQMPITAVRVQVADGKYIGVAVTESIGGWFMRGSRCMFDPPAPVVPEGVGGVTAE